MKDLFIKRYADVLISVGLGLAWYVIIFGIDPSLNPTRVAWLFGKGDLSLNYIGQSYIAVVGPHKKIIYERLAPEALSLDFKQGSLQNLVDLNLPLDLDVTSQGFPVGEFLQHCAEREGLFHEPAGI